MSTQSDVQIDQYNQEAAKIEAALKDRCPLALWHVKRLPTRDQYWMDEPLPSGIAGFRICCTFKVNGHTLEISILLTRTFLEDAAIDPLDYIAREAANCLSDAVMEWRLAVEYAV